MSDQLDLYELKTKHVPPKSQLLKWIGNKQRFASQIVSFFPKYYNCFYEPFLGSGAITATVAPSKGIGSDIYKPLIDIWNSLASNPQEVISWYQERRDRLLTEDKITVYEQVKTSFNQNPNGADFLFLSRTCYGGVIRFRKADGFMSTPCGAHTPISTNKFKERVLDWHQRIKNVEFLNIDYKLAFDLAKKGDLIYCDPPYSHSQNILYGAQSFSLEELLSKIDEAKRNGVNVVLSIDGHKKSGSYPCDLPIPSNLFETDVMIDIGRSMLKRFQMEGQSLEQEMVSDRLLMTYKV